MWRQSLGPHHGSHLPRRRHRPLDFVGPGWSISDNPSGAKTDLALDTEVLATRSWVTGLGGTQSLAQTLGNGADADEIEIENLGAPTSPSSAARLGDVSTMLWRTVSDGGYTLADGDAGLCLICSGAEAPDSFELTIATNAVVPIPEGTVVYVYQADGQPVEITPADGVTVVSSQSLISAAQHSMMMLWKRATNTWVLTGERAPSE